MRRRWMKIHIDFAWSGRMRLVIGDSKNWKPRESSGRRRMSETSWTLLERRMSMVRAWEKCMSAETSRNCKNCSYVKMA